jgi:hypothetical protein
MYLVGVGASMSALVLAPAAVAFIGAISNYRISGAAATLGNFAPTPTWRLKHWFHVYSLQYIGAACRIHPPYFTPVSRDRE